MATYTKWDSRLTEKTRVLLHVAPLISIKRSDALRGEAFSHYDGLALALKVFDVVVDNMGMPRVIDRAFLFEQVKPLLEAMDAAAGVVANAERQREMLDHVLADLRNDDNGRMPFEQPYLDFDASGAAVRRAVEFRLVSDEHHPSGGTTLCLSNEAINLYLRALELDIEDAQAAAEAVVQSQLARGKFEEAVDSAQVANLQSIRYKEKIERVLRDTQRDVRRVDWAGEVPRMLVEARDHISTRLKAEHAIIEGARERLDLVPDEAVRQRLTQILKLSKDCRKRHVDLHQHLMLAYPVFLGAHARQAFVAASASKSPDLFSQVLTPLMLAHHEQAGRVLEYSTPLLAGAQPCQAGSLKALVLWMLRPKRLFASEEIVVDESALGDASSEARRYPPELVAEVRAALQALGTRVKLSSLLAAMRERGASIESRELAAMMVLEHFAPDASSDSGILVTSGGVRFDSDGFSGDELEIEPIAGVA